MELVERSLERLPEEFASRLWNLEIEVEREPTRAELREMGLWPDGTLLGLYRGVPLTERGVDASGSIPDVITLYRGPIERECDGDEECIARQVEATLLHELAHYFGIDDERLTELGWA